MQIGIPIAFLLPNISLIRQPLRHINSEAFSVRKKASFFPKKIIFPRKKGTFLTKFNVTRYRLLKNPRRDLLFYFPAPGKFLSTIQPLVHTVLLCYMPLHLVPNAQTAEDLRCLHTRSRIPRSQNDPRTMKFLFPLPHLSFFQNAKLHRFRA